ncbi:MAG: hypothetical protein ACLFS5_12545 [Spirochaetaceae bacterium]
MSISKPPALVCIAVLLALMAGCLNPTGSEGSKEDSSGTDPPATSAEETIGPDGGTVQVESDVAVMSLNIPEDALPYETGISMTAISTIDCPTLSGGIIAGVDFEPDGLQLLKPATLAIEPKDPQVIPELLTVGAEHRLTGFSYYGDGSEFHYYPYWIVDDAVHMVLPHFSGYGAGGSSAGDRQEQTSTYLPTDAHAQAEQEAAIILGEEAERLANDPDGDGTISDESQEALLEIAQQWLETSVLPMTEDAETDDQLLDCAIIEWLSWEAQLQMHGLMEGGTHPFETEVAEIRQSIRTGLENAVDKAHERAVSNNDASEVHRLLALEAQARLLGFEDIDVSEEYEKMMRFELEFESTMIGHYLGRLFEITVETGRIPLEFAPDSSQMWLAGSGPLSHRQPISFECMIDCTLTGSTFEAENVTIGLPPYQQPSCNGRSLAFPQQDGRPTVEMFIQPGCPTETVTVQCDEEDDPFTSGGLIWYGSFGHMHEDELSVADTWSAFHIDGWDVEFGSPYAEKCYDRSDETVTESTAFTLWYAPEP